MKIRIAVVAEYDIPDGEVVKNFGLTKEETASVDTIIDAVKRIEREHAMDTLLMSDTKVAIHVNSEIDEKPISDLEV